MIKERLRAYIKHKNMTIAQWEKENHLAKNYFFHVKEQPTKKFFDGKVKIEFITQFKNNKIVDLIKEIAYKNNN